MISKIEKIRTTFNEIIAEPLYLLAVFVYSFRIAFRNSLIVQFSSYTKYLIYLFIFALLIPKVLLQKYNRRQLIASLLIALLSITGYYFNRTRNLLAIPLFLIGIKDCNIRKVVKTVFAATMCFVIIHTFGYFIDHFNNGGMLSDLPLFDRGPERSTVLCMSFNNYGTVTAMAIMQFVYLFNSWKKNKHLVFAILIILSVFFYGIGTSRSSLIVSVLTSTILLIKDNRFIKDHSRIIKIAVFAFCVLLSVSMIFMSRSGVIANYLNRLLSGRVSLSITAKETYGISLWPQVEKMLDNPIMLDNFVVYLIMVYGFILTAAFLSLVLYFAVSYGDIVVVDLLMCITYFWALTERYPENITLTVVPIVVLFEYYRKYEKN